MRARNSGVKFVGRRANRVVFLALALIALATMSGCKKGDPKPSEATPEASAPPPAPPATSFHGTYEAEARPIYVPDASDWEHTKWRGDDASDGLGKGDLTLDVDPETHAVTGKLLAPLGPAVIEGEEKDSKITATIRREDPSDLGFTGTLEATLKGDSIEGTARVAQADARLIREAKLTLERDKPGAKPAAQGK